ncbi:hypothetical protein [Enterovibrio paralichthyis]|uniref:hypothetical protein n=1 Tax=Enterovibrio paralichthyis TaxID=2853805 RepID=UPI001C4512AD|nr:hypothetical protein [Enterovibrio paralichthyis]MBV7300196.1 hypothetical protein [Enterovibrio paralichthyis]
MDERKHRIVFGYYSVTWKYGINTLEELKGMSTEVVPEDFSMAMKGKIFCPKCASPLSRTPNITGVSANNITAHFKHKSSKLYPNSKSCIWRVKSPEGLNYVNEEEARKAIEDKNLIVVSGWREFPPSGTDDISEDDEYSKTAVEDEKGPDTEVPISRHRGKEFNTPSNITTVMALCKDFPDNLTKGFYFPNSQYPMLLSDQLYSTNKITDVLPRKETLFFGKIREYRKLSYRHVVELESGGNIFKLYTNPELDKRKRLDATCVGRYLIFSTLPYFEGKNIPAAKIDLWGAYSVLPRKYDKFIRKLEY